MMNVIKIINNNKTKLKQRLSRRCTVQYIYNLLHKKNSETAKKMQAWNKYKKTESRSYTFWISGKNKTL